MKACLSCFSIKQAVSFGKNLHKSRNQTIANPEFLQKPAKNVDDWFYRRLWSMLLGFLIARNHTTPATMLINAANKIAILEMSWY
jgi:hypothetical protein